MAEKTHIGAARIEEAQKAVGLSNEAIARRIPVSEKTWRRWKQAGDIPTAALRTVAAALRLDLHELNPNGDSPVGATAQQVSVEQFEELSGKVDRILALLEPEDPQADQGSETGR